MTSINIKLTTEEAELLSNLASDQLFRREFIDPKIPGHHGKHLVERLQSMADQAKGVQTLRRNAPNVKAGAAPAAAETHNPVDIQLT